MRKTVFRMVLACLMSIQAWSADPIYWFVRSGQSLSVGSVGYCGGASPACSSGAAYGNVMLYPPDGRYPFRSGSFSTLQPRVYNGLTPPVQESSATSMCNQYAALSGRVCGTTDYGWPGAAYAALKQTAAACSGTTLSGPVFTGSGLNDATKGGVYTGGSYRRMCLPS